MIEPHIRPLGPERDGPRLRWPGTKLKALKLRLHWTRSEGWQFWRVVAYVTCSKWPTTQQPLANFASGWNLSQVFNDVEFWLLRVTSYRFAYSVNALNFYTNNRIEWNKFKATPSRNTTYLWQNKSQLHLAAIFHRTGTSQYLGLTTVTDSSSGKTARFLPDMEVGWRVK